MCENPESLIARYYGLFKLTFFPSYETIAFVVMEDFKRIPSSYVEKSYDLKGSTLKR